MSVEAIFNPQKEIERRKQALEQLAESMAKKAKDYGITVDELAEVANAAVAKYRLMETSEELEAMKSKGVVGA